MASPLVLSGFEIVTVLAEGSARVTVIRAGQTLLDESITGVQEFLPFRFTADGEVRGLVSRRGRNAGLVRAGQPPVFVGWNPDFRRIAAEVLGSGGRVGSTLYSLATQALTAVLMGGALGWGIFSFTNPLWIGGLALAWFLVSYAVDRVRDRSLVPDLKEALGGEADPGAPSGGLS